MQFSLTALIIDDDIGRRQALETIFTFLGLKTQSGDSPDCLSYLEAAEDLDAVILGSCSKSPLELVAGHPKQAFIVLGDQEDQKLLDHPNYIGLLKSDPEYDEVASLLHYCQSYKTMQRLKLNSAGHKNRQLIKLLVGKGYAIAKVSRLIEQVAATDANVLILGESGTGKEVVARAIHELSDRSKKAFVPVNCGAIPGELLESELFGHEKGAFTGAISSREGRFELASGGTLFLDEIGDMPFQMQVKLLRVLQERKFERVGSNKPIKADVRIIAATHRNLEQMVADRTFREDLYYRLNVFPIETPPLRDHADDIPLLVQELLQRHPGAPAVRFTSRALLTLMQNKWQGNVRELSNLVERLLILHPGQVVDAEDLPAKYRGEEKIADPILEREALLDAFSTDDEFEENDSFFDESPQTHAKAAEAPSLLEDDDLASAFAPDLSHNTIDLKLLVGNLEQTMIKRALKQTNGVVAKASELLGLRRTTLVEKMKKYGINAGGAA